jgi:hypothetical protein
MGAWYYFRCLRCPYRAARYANVRTCPRCRGQLRRGRKIPRRK